MKKKGNIKMKGLLIKDIRSIWNHRYMLIGAILLLILFSLVLKAEWLLIVDGILISGGLGITTFYYDEFGTTEEFLFTLPFERRTYVMEKYIFSMMMWFLSSLFLLPCILGVSTINGIIFSWAYVKELIILFELGGIFMLSCCLPICFQWGEKTGRYFYIPIITFLCGVIGYYKLVDDHSLNVVNYFEGIVNLSLLSRSIIVILCLILSFLLSIKIEQKKEK